MPLISPVRTGSYRPETSGSKDRPRRLLVGSLWVLAVGVAGLLSGCTAVESGQMMMHDTFRIFKPRGTDYRDTSEEGEDQWESVGKEARGNRPLENENDPIRDWTMSPRAKAIERNLGFE